MQRIQRVSAVDFLSLVLLLEIVLFFLPFRTQVLLVCTYSFSFCLARTLCDLIDATDRRTCVTLIVDLVMYSLVFSVLFATQMFERIQTPSILSVCPSGFFLARGEDLED
jgi:hypothetical protein